MAVDNSIVLLENVALRTRGRPDLLRTLAASREILFPLLAATSTTAVVMIPFLYLEGDLRDYYLPFVLAVTLSLVASLVVALTLTPLLSRWSLRESTPRGERWRELAQATSVRFENAFDRVLAVLLKRAWIPVTVSLVVLGGSLWVFDEKVSKGAIFEPVADTTLRVAIGLPPGADILRTDSLLRAFEDIVLEHEFFENELIERVDSLVLERRGFLTVTFIPAVGRTGVAEALKNELTVRAGAVSGADVTISGEGPGFSRGRAQVSPSYQLDLRGPDFLELERLSISVAELLTGLPRIRNVDENASGMFVEGARELVLRPDRRRMGEVGVTMDDLVTTLQPALASEVASRRIRTAEGEITGRVRFSGGRALEARHLLETSVRTSAGVPVPLGEVLRLSERELPGEIRRRDQRYERAVTFEYRGPARVGDRVVRSIVENTELPPGYTLEDGLGFFLSSEEESEIWRGLLLAVALVAMVSAALFESALLPIVALLSIPLSFVGIPFAFWATGESFDRTAYVGLILLAGIAINNALLLVHRAGRLLHRTGNGAEAARRAARERLRPILLTTATSVAGLVPLLWQGDAQAAATWRSLALSATAGLLASAGFTLLVIPCLFTLLTRRRARSATPACVPSTSS